MKPGAYFYNVGRGKTADHAAPIARLRSGHLAGAGPDVFEQEALPAESPLDTMENVTVTPHVAGRSARVRPSLRAAGGHLRRFRPGEPLRNVVRLH